MQMQNSLINTGQGHQPHSTTQMFTHNPQLNTSNVFRDQDLDVGFILRANTEVAAILHAATKDKNGDNQATAAKLQDLAITILDPNKRTYGLQIDNKMYLCTLTDLPCIVEAQKTLDYNTFYKSCDASQMLYVHNTFIENPLTKTQEEIRLFVADFCPLDDEEFKRDLY